MGNKQINNYSLDNIIDEIENQFNSNITNTTVFNNIIERLKNLLIKDPSFFINYKANEKEMKKYKEPEADNSNKNNINADNTKFERKTLKFLKYLTKIPTFIANEKLTAEFDIFISNYIEIINYLKDDKAVLDFFYYNTLEYLIDITVNEHNLSDTCLTYETKLKIIKLLDNLLILIINKPKYFNTSTIQKLHRIFLLLLNTSFISNNNNFICLLTYCNNYMLVLSRLSYNYFIKKIKPEDGDFLYKSLLYDTFNKKIITKICEILYDTNLYAKDALLLNISLLSYLINFEIVIKERYLRPDTDIKKLLYVIDTKQDPAVLSCFLTVYNDIIIQSYHSNVKEIFKHFINKKKNLLEKYFLVYETNNIEEIKIKLCLTFALIGLDSKCWEKLKTLNILKPTRNKLLNYIKLCLKSNNFNKFDNSLNNAINTNTLNDKNNNISNSLSTLSSYFDISSYIKKDKDSNIQIDTSILYTLNIELFEKTNKVIIDPNIYPKIVNYFYKTNERNYNSKNQFDLNDSMTKNNTKSLNIVKTNKDNLLNSRDSNYIIDSLMSGNNLLIYLNNKHFLLEEIVKLVYFYSLEDTYKKVKNKEFYIFYFDILIVLYYVYDPAYRYKILFSMQSFTYTHDCKAKLFKGNNKIVIEKTKERIQKTFCKLVNLIKLHSETETQNKYFAKSLDIYNSSQNNIYIQKYEENMELFKSTLENIKNLYFNILLEFGLLISIYANLFISSEFNKVSNILIDRDFFESIKDIIMFFQNDNTFNVELENKKGDYYYLTMFTNQLILLQIICFPNAKIEFLNSIFSSKNISNSNFESLSSVNNKEKQFFKEESRQYTTLLYLFNLIKNHKSNENMLHKLIYCVNRYIEVNIKFKLYQDIIINIIREILPFVYSNKSQVFVSRECIRLLLNLSKASNGFILGLKTNSKKIFIDSSNCNDLITVFRDSIIPFLRFNEININGFGLRSHEKKNYKGLLGLANNYLNKANKNYHHKIKQNLLSYKKDANLKTTYMLTPSSNKQNDKLYNGIEKKRQFNNIDNANLKDTKDFIFLPHKKMLPYKDSIGVYFHSDHSLVIPSELNLGSSYTILFKFYNPIPYTKNFSVFLQDKTGLGGIILADRYKTTLGSFTIDGIWINSGINLTDNLLLNRWVSFAMSYSEFDNQSKLCYYLNGELVKKYEEKKFFLSTNIKTIGNSADLEEPFGVWADLRIYNSYKEPNDIYKLFKNEELEEEEFEISNYAFDITSDKIINNFLKSDDLNEESFRQFIKLLNNFVNKQFQLNRLSKLELILKCLDFIDSNRYEIKKDVVKFIYNIS